MWDGFLFSLFKVARWIDATHCVTDRFFYLVDFNYPCDRDSFFCIVQGGYDQDCLLYLEQRFTVEGLIADWRCQACRPDLVRESATF